MMRLTNWYLGCVCAVVWGVGSPVSAALVPGDLAFVGFNTDGSDGFAFVALHSLDPSSTIYFRDDEIIGGVFNTGESVITWQSGVSAIASGTVIRISNVASGGITSDIGSTSVTGVPGFGNSNEGLFAYTGVDPNTPTTFLSAIFNGTAVGSGSDLTGTGLVLGTNAIEFGNNFDIFEYTGDRSSLATFTGYQSLVNNPANWISEDGAGDQSINGTAPDVPFNNTSFSTISATPEPSALLLSLGSGITLLGWWWQTQRKLAQASLGQSPEVP